jgi:hypothetical protein
MTYCTHLGPCGAGCPCAKRESACERTCHVSQISIIRSRKLTCVSVMRNAQDAGEDVNVVGTLRMLARSVYLGNALVGSKTDIAILDYAHAVLRTFCYTV